MKKEYALVDSEEYRLTLSLDDLDFDYYTDIAIQLIIDKKRFLLFKDNLLALKNIVEQYDGNIYTLSSELDEEKLGILLNEYYRGSYEDKFTNDIVLDVHGHWVGEKYCCFLSLKYATWLYKYDGNIIFKVTPVFSSFERKNYILQYDKFIKKYNDLFKEEISLQQIKNVKKIILELYAVLL